jgi:hypothetical protein
VIRLSKKLHQAKEMKMVTQSLMGSALTWEIAWPQLKRKVRVVDILLNSTQIEDDPAWRE